MFRKLNKQGYNLMELIVVIIIIGVLIAMAVPKYLDHKRQADLAVIQNDSKVVQNVAMTEYMSTDKLPKGENKREDYFVEHISKGKVFRNGKLVESKDQIGTNPKVEIVRSGDLAIGGDLYSLRSQSIEDYWLLDDTWVRKNTRSALKGEFLLDSDFNVYYVAKGGFGSGGIWGGGGSGNGGNTDNPGGGSEGSGETGGSGNTNNQGGLDGKLKDLEDMINKGEDSSKIENKIDEIQKDIDDYQKQLDDLKDKHKNGEDSEIIKDIEEGIKDLESIIDDLANKENMTEEDSQKAKDDFADKQKEIEDKISQLGNDKDKKDYKDKIKDLEDKLNEESIVVKGGLGKIKKVVTDNIIWAESGDVYWRKSTNSNEWVKFDKDKFIGNDKKPGEIVDVFGSSDFGSGVVTLKDGSNYSIGYYGNGANFNNDEGSFIEGRPEFIVGMGGVVADVLYSSSWSHHYLALTEDGYVYHDNQYGGNHNQKYVGIGLLEGLKDYQGKIVKLAGTNNVPMVLTSDGEILMANCGDYGFGNGKGPEETKDLSKWRVLEKGFNSIDDMGPSNKPNLENLVDLPKFVAIDKDSNMFAAVDKNGDLWTWGYASSWEFGHGNDEGKINSKRLYYPVKVARGKDSRTHQDFGKVVDVKIFDDSMFIKDDKGYIYAAGPQGQIANENNKNKFTRIYTDIEKEIPLKNVDLDNLEAGFAYGNDGRVYFWGMRKEGYQTYRTKHAKEIESVGDHMLKNNVKQVLGKSRVLLKDGLIVNWSMENSYPDFRPTKIITILDKATIIEKQ